MIGEIATGLGGPLGHLLSRLGGASQVGPAAVSDSSAVLQARMLRIALLF